MEQITDWAKLWKELAEINNRRHERSGPSGSHSRWHKRAEAFHNGVVERWAKPDSSRALVLSYLTPDSSLLDIGAGSGAWAILAARKAQLVTALEPDADMLAVMNANIAGESIENIHVIKGAWPETTVEVHDYSLCSHAMYGVFDLPAFIRKMEAVTRKMCFFLIRQPSLDGIMANAARMVWGHPFDSPNFIVAYNTLFQMGIYANALYEDSGYWKPWAHDSLEDALAEIKLRLDLKTDEFDARLHDLLARRLTFVDGKVVWPPSNRSVLVYWKPTHDAGSN